MVNKQKATNANNKDQQGELAKLVAKTLADVIRFTTDPEMRRSCLESLDVTNSYDAEKILRDQLVNWTPRKDEPEKEPEAQHQPIRVNQLLREAIEDLEGWD